MLPRPIQGRADMSNSQLFATGMRGVITRTAGREQRCFTLIEAMVAMLIFSIGILALVGMYTVSVNASRDGQYRIEASNFASQIIQTIQSEVCMQATCPPTAGLGATSGVVNATDFQLFRHAGGAPCAGPIAAPSTKPAVLNWIAQVQAAGTSGLPGSLTPGYQQIDTTVTSLFPGVNLYTVTVTVCWMAPDDTLPHQQSVVGYVIPRL